MKQSGEDIQKTILAKFSVQVSWYPESVYTLDICESEGKLYVLELGSFSCAGEYACDLSAIVDFGAKAAWEDYEAVNQFQISQIPDFLKKCGL